MAKFCGKCGRPLMEGEVCNCSEQQGNAGGTQWNGQPQGNWQNGEGEYEGTRYSRNYSTFGLWDSLKAALGIGNPELDGSDVYEEGKKIIPDIVKPNEGEVPIRQYELSSMRSTMFGITYAKAKGRLQVTNKRVMFRAPGKGIGGRTCLQHEFLVDEIGGVEAREEIMFNIGEMVLTFLVMLIGQMLAAVVMEIIENGMKSKMFFYFISVLFGSAALVPFFLVDKKWKLKAFLAGISVGVISVLVSILEDRIFGEF